MQSILAGRRLLSILPCAHNFIMLSGVASSSTTTTTVVDPVQAVYLDEQCILVNERDGVLGSATKRVAHSVETIKRGAALHRAFSVFAFNGDSELLLQQRSSKKITFPLLWTNTCCSHPLHNEAELPNQPFGIGVKRAAARKMKHELGAVVDPDGFTLVNRFLYKALSDDQWGEHELDYCLILRNLEANRLAPNSDEVAAVRYVTKEQLLKESDAGTVQFSPWFSLLIKHRWLLDWWGSLNVIHQKEISTQDTGAIVRLNP